MTPALELVDVAAGIRAGRHSAEAYITDCLDRISATHATINAFIGVEADHALERARAVDQARERGDRLGPLAGVPIALKDNICTATGKTTCGSRILEPFAAPYNAFVVDRLESAGAIIVGKTNLDEFAMGSSTENSAYSVTPNPWNTQCVAGGSSGGSAAAVAANLVPGALGTDTGGSIRQPASFCGVVGLKPTYGRVSRFGLVAFGSSLDQIGPLGRTARDAALLLQVVAGHDVRDSTSADQPVPDYIAALDRPMDGTRVGVAGEHGCEGLDGDVRSHVESARGVLADCGCEMKTINLPHTRYAIAAYYVIATAEASSNLARFDGVHYGHRAETPTDIIDLVERSRGEGFGPEVKRRIMLGTYALSSGYYDQYYSKASRVRTLIRRDFAEAFRQVDIIAGPVAPTTAFAIGQKMNDPLHMYLSDVYTVSANLSGICAISVPAGFDREGMPIGLQLMAPPFAEEKLLALAHQFQQRTDHHTKIPAPLV